MTWITRDTSPPAGRIACPPKVESLLSRGGHAIGRMPPGDRIAAISVRAERRRHP